MMNSIDLTPFYRSSIGFDRLGSLINNSLSSDVTASYPPYNIEVIDENQYAISLAVAGFDQSELDIKVEQGVLTVRGEKTKQEQRQYLHQGIANRMFERKFNLDDHVEVTEADLRNGLLTICLVREIPEAMKPRHISISQSANTTEQKIRNKSEHKSSMVAA